MKSKEEWLNYCLSGKKPDDVPTKPDRVYKSEWKWWADWLGYEGEWNIKKIKELLRALIASNVIYQWNEAVLYSFLLRKGVLSLTGNRHAQFFRDIIRAARTDDGRRIIEDYANSDSETPPDLSALIKQNVEPTEEIETATSNELIKLSDRLNPLDYGEPESVEQILENTNILESINVDQEAMQFYLYHSIDEFWKCAFRDERGTVDKIRREGKNGNKYHDTVVETFLSDYVATKDMALPEGYSFPFSPTLMQLFVAYKVKINQHFSNFSGTGTGKTLSAVLASRIVNSKMTLIVCPNDVVEQWTKSIRQIFPDSLTKASDDVVLPILLFFMKIAILR